MVKVFLIGGEEMQFILGSYALKNALKDLNRSVSDITNILNEQSAALEFTESFIYHSRVFWLLKNERPINIQHFHVNEWIDEDGGYSGNLFGQFMAAAMESIGINRSDGGDVVEEKKSK